MQGGPISMSFVRCLQSAARRGGICAVLLASATGLRCTAEKPAAASERIPLESLGFPGYPVALLHAGASMATVHVLDKTHVLFTYSMRSLVPRLPGADVNDAGRLVAGEVVELPTGKVLARTEWHLHDHGRYLWSAGQGLFVLRVGQELSLFAPLRGLATGTSFQRAALPHRPGQPELIESSPDGRILMVQMQHPDETQTESAAADEEPKHKRTTIEFYRLSAEQPERPVQIKSAGVVGSPGFLRLAVDGDGYLWAEDQHRNEWAVSFNEYEGKPQSLAAVHSACAPTLRLLSRSQFAALSCRTDTSPQLSVYGFDGHENWEEPFGETLQAPTFISAPNAGRFAFSRFYATSTGSGTSGLGVESPLSEEIRVYGTESGDLLLHVQCDPVARTAENFDLSADGRTLAVLGSKSLDLYTLPDLTAKDRKDLAEVETMRPPESHGSVVLRRITRPIHEGLPEAEEAAGAEETTAAGAATTATSAAPMEAPTGAVAAAGGDSAAGGGAGTPGGGNAAAAAAAAQSDSGAPRADASRKPPTLLNPGESPEYKSHNSAPQ